MYFREQGCLNLLTGSTWTGICFWSFNHSSEWSRIIALQGSNHACRFPFPKKLRCRIEFSPSDMSQRDFEWRPSKISFLRYDLFFHAPDQERNGDHKTFVAVHFQCCGTIAATVRKMMTHTATLDCSPSIHDGLRHLIGRSDIAYIRRRPSKWKPQN